MDNYVYLPCYWLSRIYIGWGPCYFRHFRKIFLPNIGEDQKNGFTIRARAPGTEPYGQSTPGCCITFTKKLNEGLK